VPWRRVVCGVAYSFLIRAEARRRHLKVALRGIFANTIGHIIMRTTARAEKATEIILLWKGKAGFIWAD